MARSNTDQHHRIVLECDEPPAGVVIDGSKELLEQDDRLGGWIELARDEGEAP